VVHERFSDRLTRLHKGCKSKTPTSVWVLMPWLTLGIYVSIWLAKFAKNLELTDLLSGVVSWHSFCNKTVLGFWLKSSFCRVTGTKKWHYVSTKTYVSTY
jgi:hypothetical protein